METTNAKLFMKMAAVMGKCRTITKGGTNTFDKYDYVRADDISIRIGALLAAEGIMFLPSMVLCETSEYTTQKGGTNFRTVAHFQMTFACNETGATYTSMWSGEAIDRSDKSISKAATSAVKYFLLKTFLLSGGDDDDSDAASPEVEARAPRKAAVEPASDDLDAIWETPAQHAKKPDTLSAAQLQRIHILGREVHGKDWETEGPRMVAEISNGKTSSKDLTAAEAAALISDLEAKRKQPNGNGHKVAA